jgi:hypothetical protein
MPDNSKTSKTDEGFGNKNNDIGSNNSEEK